MQPIERYGVIALVFLLVTIGAVLIWGPGGDAEDAPEGKLAQSTAQERAPRGASDPTRSFQPTLPLGRAQASSADRATWLDRERAGQSTAEHAAPGSGAENPGTSPAASAPAMSLAQGPSTELQRSRTTDAQSPSPTAKPAIPFRTAPSTSASRSYVVKAGDTLSEIAMNELGSAQRWKEIQTLNANVSPTSLKVGMKLELPAGAPATAKSSAAAPTRSPSGVLDAQPALASASRGKAEAGWIVAAGDSLWRIAERSLGDGMRWKEIEELNPGLASRALEIGEVIALPAGAHVESTSRPGGTLLASSGTSSAQGAGSGRVR